MTADAYADSSFLVSLHSADANHGNAVAFLSKSALSLTYSPLHRIEVRNALRNLTAAGVMTTVGCRRAFRQLEEDLRDGFLVHATIDWADVLRRADELSEKHSSKDGQRAIDLLHVSLALELKMKVFLTFDIRQARLARAVGLRIKP